MLDKLIQDMQEKGLAFVAPIALKGKSKPVLSFIDLMANTISYRPDSDQCEYLAQRSARDGGATW